MKGKHVIVRADRAGVFFGIYVKEEAVGNHTAITLQNVRKLHYWEGAAAVEEISQIGTKKPNKCRFTVEIPDMVIADPIQIIPATKQAIAAINSVEEWRA